jgi:hypothetical protein
VDKSQFKFGLNAFIIQQGCGDARLRIMILAKPDNGGGHGLRMLMKLLAR